MKALIPIFLLCLFLTSCEKETIDPVRCYRCETTMNDAVITYVTVCGITNIADFQQGLQAQISAIFHEDCEVKCTKTNDALTPSAGLLVYDSDLNVLKIYAGGVWKIIITAN
jgi:hypothetical protein